MKLIIVKTQDANNTIYSTPDSCILRNNENFYMPDFSNQIDACLTIVIKIKKIGKNIGERFASRYYDEVSVGIKMEASDVLQEIKSEGKPWDTAVAFDYSAPHGIFTTKEDEQKFTLYINDEIIDTINSSDFNINQIISEVSHLYTLKIGDLIYICSNKTSKVEIGQTFSAKINDNTSLKCIIK